MAERTSAASATADLEAQLRDMILGNVTMSPAAAEPPQRGGRYRQHQARGHRQQQPSRGGLQQQDQNGFNDRRKAPNQHFSSRGARDHQRLFNPHQVYERPGETQARCASLENIAHDVLRDVEMSQSEFESKESFRQFLQDRCREAVFVAYHDVSPVPEIELVPFGSFASGFAMPGSDMDLALVASHFPHGIFRILQKTLLDHGIGARLISRTRVPILKICSNPTQELIDALREDREKFDAMSPEEQDAYDNPDESRKVDPKNETDADAENGEPQLQIASKKPVTHNARNLSQDHGGNIPKGPKSDPLLDTAPVSTLSLDPAALNQTKDSPTQMRQRKERPWFRERQLGPLDFPKTGVGIQCDINFQNPLGICNTELLRCYSMCDIRVRLMVLFVKKWASQRKVNSSRNGTLSSYGYVLMVLHFLVNVAKPPVCPNLQLCIKESQYDPGPDPNDPSQMIEGCDVRFWRDAEGIQRAAFERRMTRNLQPLGELLHEFFHYYSSQGQGVPSGGFVWVRDALSLRSPSGLLRKEYKGWTGAKTTIVDRKEVRNRYLFAIEDPFETTHNVGRTVTHHGLVAIRDEFRRAWRIILGLGGRTGWVNNDGHLFDEMISIAPPSAEETSLEKTAGMKAAATTEDLSKDKVEANSVAVVASVMENLGISTD